MLQAFEAVTAILHSESLIAALEPLQIYNAAFSSYGQQFKEWKSQDQSNLTRRIERVLLDLAEALEVLQTEDAGDSGASGQRAQILSKVGSLRAQLRRIGGEEGLASFDRRHPAAAACTTAAGE